MKYGLLLLIITFCALDAQFTAIPPTPIPLALTYHIPTMAQMAQAQANSWAAQALDTKHKKELEPALVTQPISSELLTAMERNREHAAKKKQNEERCARLVREAIKRDVPYFPLNHYQHLFQQACYHLQETTAFKDQSLDRIEMTDSRYFNRKLAIEIITLACVPFCVRQEEEVRNAVAQQNQFSAEEVHEASWNIMWEKIREFLPPLMKSVDPDKRVSGSMLHDLYDAFKDLRTSQDPEVQQFLQMPVTINIKPLPEVEPKLVPCCTIL